MMIVVKYQFKILNDEIHVTKFGY